MANDIKKWKDLGQDLLSMVEENRTVVSQAQKEIEAQIDKNKKEAYAMLKDLQAQIVQIDELIEILQEKDLFENPTTTLETLEQQKLKSQQMAEQVGAQLQENEEAQVRTRRNKEKNVSYHPKHFKDSFLLGNWICYFPGNRFSCQSYWKDKTFKEYVFENSKLISEREGTYELQPGKLILRDMNKVQEFTIVGFSDDSIEYEMDGRRYLFQYMPEELLNSFLQGQNRRRSGQKSRVSK